MAEEQDNNQQEQDNPQQQIIMQLYQQFKASPYYKHLYQNKGAVAAWFNKDEGKHFFAFIQETLDALVRQLVTSPKHFALQRNGQGEVVAAEREDLSDVIRGQLIAYEQIMELPKILRQGIQKEIAALLEKEKENK